MADTNIDPREANLPKWARNILQALRHNNAMLTERLAQLPPSRITVDDTYEKDIPQQYLSNGARVRFALGERHDEDIEVFFSREADEPNVLTIHGGRSLTIHPWVSNVVKVSLEAR